jgi:hypothetical protein
LLGRVYTSGVSAHIAMHKRKLQQLENSYESFPPTSIENEVLKNSSVTCKICLGFQNNLLG